MPPYPFEFLLRGEEKMGSYGHHFGFKIGRVSMAVFNDVFLGRTQSNWNLLEMVYLFLHV